MSAHRENSRQSISDLDDNEKAALAKLIRLVARSDGDLSSEERVKIDCIAIDAGGDSFWALLDAAAASEDDLSTILSQIASVGTKDGHEVIYGVLYELSIVEAGGDGENELLAQIAAGWNLSIDDAPDNS